ncbi:MAG: DUF1926 domain-containing protein [Candidatus Omnitrophica bacterium]|nr:DUF1926 domain-containing protein [Candidatus Omnitrophota bacterium]MDD5488570.1 DUF1926 domain-containing protein [Candidatus Omnitrophota bacterium]
MRSDLAMAIHFHQPIGNFDFVIERACDNCYMPFLELLEKYPDIKMSFHFTGCLLEWAERCRPELIDVVKGMVARGQVEVISGGFYEPILPSIPDGDRVRQIKMLSSYIEDKMSFKPRGAWIAERVWEPGLPSDLVKAGVEYVILDDTHFLYSGIYKDATYGYYITEDNGKTLAIFPSDKVLRYMIPFKMPNECMDYMKGVMERHGEPLFVYGDDGEKFGEWPGTYKWVFEEKWLEKFFDELMNNAEWLKTMWLSQALDKHRPLGRVYIPTSSYEEMLEWSLPAGSQEHLRQVMEDIKRSGKEEFYKPFVKGGFWRNFLSKYPESNNMNKKMVYVSGKLDKIRASKKVDAEIFSEAEKDLMRGQCNCPYWHGVFGGLYLFHLRRAIYHHLIKSEKAIDGMLYGAKQICGTDTLDIDADGDDEVLLWNRDMSILVDPSEGGVIKEFDSKVICQNLTNTLARRKEAYHKTIIEKSREQAEQVDGQVKTIHDGIQVVQAGITEHLNYDWYGRYCLIDHFPGSETHVSDIKKAAYSEEGDLVNARYEFSVNGISASKVSVTMSRTGNVKGKKISISKEVTAFKKDAAFSVKYVITNQDKSAVETLFAPEFNVALPDADSDKYKIVAGKSGKEHSVKETFESGPCDKIEIKDKESGLSYSVSAFGMNKIWCFPVETVSQSEKAYELNYQGSAVIPVFKVKLRPGEAKSIDLDVRFS